MNQYLIAGIFVLMLILAGVMYGHGRSTGGDSVRLDQSRQVESARKDRDTADREVHSTPYLDRVEGLR